MIDGGGLRRRGALGRDMKVREGLRALGAQGHAFRNVLDQVEAAGRPSDLMAGLASENGDAADTMASLADRKERRLLRGRAAATGDVDVVLGAFAR